MAQTKDRQSLSFIKKNSSHLAPWGNLTMRTPSKKTPGLKPFPSTEEPAFKALEGYWVKCPSCQAIVTKTLVQDNLETCTECSHHFRISAIRRIQAVVDKNSFQEKDADLKPGDPLNFFDSKPYPERIASAQKKTKMSEGFVSGTGFLNNRRVEIGSFEFSFMGGSMGTVVGEKIARLFDRALESRNPAIVFQASGGARMQEGILSLMQMAKTTCALSKLKKAGVPFISVLTDPTTGGVAASFAMLGDLNIAEPKALIGFAGPRVISQTINQKLPDDFQRAEFLLKHGMIDAIVPRKDLRNYLSRVLSFMVD
jgi:acetyl-CoA carboxylase carboxyl transferase subunit beta